MPMKQLHNATDDQLLYGVHESELKNKGNFV
jgi:hypothetical protein